MALEMAREGAERMKIDKQWLREQFAKQDVQQGASLDPSATVETLRAMMVADGIVPERNEFSREILRDRYPADDTRRE